MGKGQPIGPGLRAAGTALRGTGKGVAFSTKFTIKHWRPMLPLLCMAAAFAFDAVAHLTVWAYQTIWDGDPVWGWVGVALFGLLLLIMADDQVGQMRWEERPTPVLLEAYTLASVLVLILTDSVEATALVVGGCLTMWIAWKRSRAFNRFKLFRDGRHQMEQCLAKMGISDATRVSDPEVRADGSTVWQVYLGDNDNVDQVKAERVVHMLKTDLDRVIVTRVKGSTRKIQITHLAKSPDKGAEKVHPATLAKNRKSGGSWEPGVRSIREGLPIGTALGAISGDDPVSAIRVYNKHDDARSVMLLGKSGSGKTNTTSAALLSAIACGDVVLGIADVPKVGKLAAPFEAAAHRVARTLDQFEADMDRLYALAQYRSGRLSRGEIRTPEGDRAAQWVPSSEHPAVVYFIDELANTMLAAEKDAERGVDLWLRLIELAQFVREFGIILVPISQTAKKDMVRHDFTSQLGTFVIHQLKKVADAGDIPWGGYDVDFLESGLPQVGMSLVGDINGGAPVKSMSYDMNSQIGKERAWAKVIADYVPHRPMLEAAEVAILGWGDALCGAQSADQTQGVPQSTPAVAPAPAGAVGASKRAGLLTDAVDEDPVIPTGAGVLSGPVPTEDGDDERRRIILDALAADDSGDGLGRSSLDKAIKDARVTTSPSTTRRVLQGLMDEGLVGSEGQGRGARYSLSDDARAAA